MNAETLSRRVPDGRGPGPAGVLVAITAADEEFLSFSLPAGSLVVIVALAALAGVLAGLRPASRAAKLDPLRAISTE